MSKRFDFVITEARAYTLKLEACNTNFTGAITAQAIPVFSLPTAVLQGYGIPFGKGEFLRQYSQPGGVGTPLTNPVQVPAVNLTATVTGKTISIGIPFGANFNSNSVEYISGGSPREYTLVVSHGGATVLTGLISISLASTLPPGTPAAFSICDAKAA